MDNSFVNEQAALAAFAQNRNARETRGNGRVYVNLGRGPVDVTKYMGMKYPGAERMRMIGDPYVLFADGDAQRQRGVTYVWRKPRDRFTLNMLKRQVLVPVYVEDIDNNEFAAVDTQKEWTPMGPREVVMWEGLGLFRMESQEAQKHFTAWEQWYLRELGMLKSNVAADFARQGFSPMPQGGNLDQSDTRKQSPFGEV